MELPSTDMVRRCSLGVGSLLLDADVPSGYVWWKRILGAAELMRGGLMEESRAEVHNGEGIRSQGTE